MGSQVRGLSPKKATRCVLSRTSPAQYGVPGAWSQPEEGGGGDEAGTRPERLSSTNVESQVRDLGPKKVKVGCLKPEEGELQEEATTSSKDLLSEYVLGAWSQPEEDRGGDKVRGLNLKRMEAGTRPAHFSSTNIGSEVRGLNSNRCMVSSWRKEKGRGINQYEEAQAEEDRGKNEVWKFKLKKTQAWKLKLKKGKDKVRILKKKKAGCVVSVEEGGGRDEAGALILNQYGVPGAWSQPEEGDEAGALFLNQYVPGACSEAGARILNQYGVPGACSRGPGRRNMGFQARGLSPKKAEAGTRPELGSQVRARQGRGRSAYLNQYGVPGAKAEAGTRPERLSSTNVESQVRDLGTKKVKVGCLKPEEGELQEEATTSSKDLLSEYVLGAWSQPEEDGGGDKVRGLNLKRMEAGTRPEHFSSTNIGSEVRGLTSNRKRKLKKTEVWKFKLKKTEAWKLKMKKGKDKVWKLKPKKTEARTIQGMEACAKAEAGTRPERLSSTNVESQVRDLGPKKVKVGCLKPEEGELQEEATTSSKDLLSEYVLGAWSQPEEDRGGDKVRGLNLKRMEAGTRPEHFSSTNIGSEVRGLNSNRKLKLKKTEVWKFKLKKTQAWKLKLKKGKDKVRILKKKKAGSGNEAVQARLHGVPGAWSQSKKAEAGTRPAQYGVPGAWSQPEEGGGGDEAGTRPERLSSPNVESQVRDLGPKKVKVGCLKPEEGELQEEATTGGDKAGSPILNCHGFPGARSQLEEDGGGNQDGGEERPEYLCKDKAGVKAQAEEDRGRDKAWKLKLKKGKDK
ncbi:unnamed protein product, partial [Symbiodinium sp. CCMP2592]